MLPIMQKTGFPYRHTDVQVLFHDLRGFHILALILSLKRLQRWLMKKINYVTIIGLLHITDCNDTIEDD